MRCAPALVVLLLAACDSGGGAGSGGLLGGECSKNSDCASGVCLPLAGLTSVCTEGCADVREHDCPSGWSCRRPDEVAALVCVCEPTSAFEICEDGEDNDCDGQIDDCITCGAALVPPTSTLHCGGCDRRCVPGGACDDGECVCDAEDPADCVVEPGDAQCSSDADCDDRVDCTTDRCVQGMCTSRVDLRACEPGESCNPFEGCTPGASCVTINDCLDQNPCTDNERCLGGTCVFEPLDLDVDGFLSPLCGGLDCNDVDGSISPGALEQCDGIDNTCDGVIDEPLSPRACGAGAICELGACGCPNGLFDCGNFDQAECTDRTSDPLHCGACGNVCGAGFTCVDSNCTDVDECEAGLECPSHSVCVNVIGDVECRCESGFTPDANAVTCIDFNECVNGSHDCSANATCANVEGGFTCSCNPGYTGNGRNCSDVNECNAGDVAACGLHGYCLNYTGTYTCVCEQGYGFDSALEECVVVDQCQAHLLPHHDFCDGACEPLLTSEDHCGGCGNSCYGGGAASCVNGDCACTDVQQTFCEGSGCVNTASSVDHCGDCNEACPIGAGCVGGDCFCPVDTESCDGTCVALGTTSSCLGCDDACPLFATCEEEGCTCPAGTPTTCDGECVNTATDERYCSDCETACPSGATCTGGACDCPDATPDTCDGYCVDYQSDERSCGACGTSCGVVCNEGDCQTATQIALGLNFGCVLFSDEQVGCFGLNNSGQLGRNLSVGVLSTDLGLLALEDISKIAADELHACALSSTGALSCWGENGSSQLGAGTTDALAPVATRSGVSDMVVGDAHTCVVLSSNGTIECIGSDASGQHGDGATVTANTAWSAVSNLSNVDKLVSGNDHVCALDGGVISCWGSNASGQIGIGTTDPVVATPTVVIGLTGVDDIDAGGDHTCAVVNGTVYCWGLNTSFQGGDPNAGNLVFAMAVGGVTDAVAVATGETHTCVLRSSGNVTCWGSGSYGENGRFVTSYTHSTKAGPFHGLAAGGAHTCALDEVDNMGCWGSGAATALVGDSSSPRELDR